MVVRKTWRVQLVFYNGLNIPIANTCKQTIWMKNQIWNLKDRIATSKIKPKISKFKQNLKNILDFFILKLASWKIIPETWKIKSKTWKFNCETSNTY